MHFLILKPQVKEGSGKFSEEMKYKLARIGIVSDLADSSEQLDLLLTIYTYDLIIVEEPEKFKKYEKKYNIISYKTADKIVIIHKNLKYVSDLVKLIAEHKNGLKKDMETFEKALESFKSYEVLKIDNGSEIKIDYEKEIDYNKSNDYDKANEIVDSNSGIHQVIELLSKSYENLSTLEKINVFSKLLIKHIKFSSSEANKISKYFINKEASFHILEPIYIYNNNDFKSIRLTCKEPVKTLFPLPEEIGIHILGLTTGVDDVLTKQAIEAKRHISKETKSNKFIELIEKHSNQKGQSSSNISM